jgi:hypothetical protein
MKLIFFTSAGMPCSIYTYEIVHVAHYKITLQVEFLLLILQTVLSTILSIYSALARKLI